MRQQFSYCSLCQIICLLTNTLMYNMYNVPSVTKSYILTKFMTRLGVFTLILTSFELSADIKVL